VCSSDLSLEKLKDTRERVRDELAPDAGGTARRAVDDTAPIPVASAKRRFDVGDVQASKPVGDLQDALGGAKAVEPSAKPPKPARTPAEGDTGGDEDVTSRLLRAKRRAKKGMDDKE
jgi:hypothetical protein